MLTRPAQANAMDRSMWEEIPKGLEWLEAQGARCIVLSGEGKHFCGGIDLGSLAATAGAQEAGSCTGRARYQLREFIQELQAAMSALERCAAPVVAAVHGACVGAGVDLVTAADIRLATADARLCVKEVDLAIVADMGTLQRLPGIVGDGVARDLALTGCTITGQEAAAVHLVSRTFPTREALLAGALELARGIAGKSPLTVAGAKKVLLYQRDHSVQDGLEHVATWNAAMLQSADMQAVLEARATGRAPIFSKL